MILDKWMPILSDVELRILLVVTRQTLGWLWDPNTKMRKKEDWISRGQLVRKTGKSPRSISDGIKALVEKFHVIEARDSRGGSLETASKRRAKFGKIYYRLSLHQPAQGLFGVNVGKVRRGQNFPRQKSNTTKETLIQKENLTKIAEIRKSFGKKFIMSQ